MRHSDIRNLLFCCVWGLTGGIAFAAWAEDAVIINPGTGTSTMILDNDSKESVISGVVKDVRGDSLLLSTNAGKDVRVDLEDFELDRSTRELIEPGMELTMQGEFKRFGPTPEFEASSLMRTGGSTILRRK